MGSSSSTGGAGAGAMGAGAGAGPTELSSSFLNPALIAKRHPITMAITMIDKTIAIMLYYIVRYLINTGPRVVGIYLPGQSGIPTEKNLAFSQDAR